MRVTGNGGLYEANWTIDGLDSTGALYLQNCLAAGSFPGLASLQHLDLQSYYISGVYLAGLMHQ